MSALQSVSSNNIFRRTAALAVLVAATTLPAQHAQSVEDESHPNIVVFFVDDMGYADPSCFGNPAIKTPNIDRLAAEGIRLTNFYINSPICSASRVALTTGRYPQRYRIHSYLASRAANRQRKMPNWLDPDAPTLAKLLKLDRHYAGTFNTDATEE